MSLLWLDLETTGLDCRTEHVLEVAAIITDDALNEVARFERVIYSPLADHVLDLHRRGALNDDGTCAPGDHTTVHPIVVKMHLANGLWEASRRGEALATVDADLAAFICKHAVKVTSRVDAKTGEAKAVIDRPQLAGSTISFDREFMSAHLPRALAELNHRNVDVSTLNEVARRFWKPVYDARPRTAKVAHRGMADIQASIEGLQHYLANLGPIATVLS